MNDLALPTDPSVTKQIQQMVTKGIVEVEKIEAVLKSRSTDDSQRFQPKTERIAGLVTYYKKWVFPIESWSHSFKMLYPKRPTAYNNYMYIITLDYYTKL